MINLRSLTIVLFAILLQGCGGGGGGGGGTAAGGGAAPAAAPSIMVSGLVQAPGGLVASLQQDQWPNRLASLFISPSYADILGLASVPNGTLVELVQVDPVSGVAGAPLATTSVSAGHYSFNLTSLGLSYSTTLQVRLASSSGVQMRTFVTGAVANLDPNSEAGVQLVLDGIAAKPGSSLNLMTVKDLDDVEASVDMLTSAAGISAGGSTAATVAAIKTKLNIRPELAALLNTKLTPGHAPTGPGDIANYFPLTTGDTWTYSLSNNGLAATSAQIMAVGAATARSGASVMPITTSTSSFPLPAPGGVAPVYKDTSYYVKDASGLISYGNSTDPSGITALAPSYLEIKLPAKPGDAWTSFNKVGNFNLGLDMDGDGITETITTYKLDKLVTGYQTVTVPAGVFRSMVIENHVQLSIQLSRSKITVTSTGISTWFLAPGVGLVRMVDVINGSSSNGTTIPQSMVQRDLVDATVSGINIKNRPPVGTQTMTISLVHNDLIYDKTRNRLYASIPGAAVNGNSIAVINPDTGAILQTVPVGPEPLRLAISKGDEYLYVGLDGTGEVARINLATMVVDLKFALGSTPGIFPNQLFVQDLAVLPNNPLSVVVTEKVKGLSPSFGGIAIFDGAVKRINGIPGWGLSAFTADAIAVADNSATVYGVDNQISSFEFTRFAVAPTGITFIDQTNGLAGNFLPTRISNYAGRIYSTNGRVIDPVNRLLAGTYQLSGASPSVDSCIPDALPARAYCLAYGAATITLASFDQTLFTQLATVDTKLPTSTFKQTRMVRFGTRGFAIGANTGGNPISPYDKLYLITSDIAL